MDLKIVVLGTLVLNEVVEAILNQVDYSGMQENYANHNVDLILWIYDKDEWREASLRDCVKG